MGRISVDIDAAHGGRWTSLRSASGREWLWSRQALGRGDVRPGDAFVDAGGLEECLPTIGGVPDHGDAWARPWTPAGDVLAVDGDGYRLERAVRSGGDTVTAHYRLTASPGWRFIWAAHALLDVSTDARLRLPTGHPTVVAGNDTVRTVPWPYLDGEDLARLGDVDGTALMITLPDLRLATVVDGRDRLTMEVECPTQPTAVAIWRNLGGWPGPDPYRSIGVEPMLGRVPRLSAAGPDDAACVPASGVAEWTLRITADRPAP